MNLYDKAHELARALEASEEMRQLLQAKEALAGDEAAAKMVREFLNLQVQAEYHQLLGKEGEFEGAAQLQQLGVLVQNNHVAREYLEAFMRWQRTAADIQKIIGDVLGRGLPETDAQA
ncbi:MAG: YlbF family regulator [Veillonellaceae bacterium]|nr:YlbF family regulator [Veillonellaceae bacterium]